MNITQIYPRVLMVAASYYPFMGGLETHIYEVSRRMKDYNIDVTILTTDRTGSLPETDVIDGIPVRRVTAYPADKDYYFAPKLIPTIRNIQCDIVHCQGGMTLVPPMAMYAARRAKLPYLLSFHSNTSQSALRRNVIRPIQYRILRHFAKDAAYLVAVSKFESSFFQEHLHLSSEKFVVIPNGSGLPQVENPPQPNPDQPMIVSAGRLHYLKGHQRIIRAMPSILASVPTAHLRIAGRGDYESELRQLVLDLGLESHVTIQEIPPENREAMTALLSSAALVVLLSQYEAHPLGVLEALSLGCPILVTYTSGLMEFADDGLVQSVALNSNSNQIALKVIEQLQHPAYPPHTDLPTWEDSTRNLAQLYNNLIKDNNI